MAARRNLGRWSHRILHALADVVAPLFRSVQTIELDPQLARIARDRLAVYSNVIVHEGDSSVLLREVLSQVGESAIFWLDAHYSGGRTARGSADTPVLAELQAIAAHPVRPHAVFIDDARMFGVDPA